MDFELDEPVVGKKGGVYAMLFGGLSGQCYVLAPTVGQ